MGFLVGISGSQFAGMLCLELLEINKDVSIRGFCRNAAKVSKELSASLRVEIFQCEAYNPEQLAKFAKGLLIDACENEKVPRYMASDWALHFSKLELDQLPQKDLMKLVKAYVETKQLVKGVHILNGIFFDTIFSPFFEIYDAKTHKFSHYGLPDVGFEGTSYKNSFEYTARVILNKDATVVQRIIGDRKTMPDIAKSFEKVYGLKANVVVQGPAKELYEKMTTKRAQNPTKHTSGLQCSTSIKS